MPNSSIVHVIDDDEAVRHSLTFLLESAGLSVRSYASATSFLDALPDSPAGCIITDVRMPDIDGLELLSRLKTQGIRLPVIVMTGHGDVPVAVEAMKRGAIDFLEKPFDDDAMLASVQTAFTRLGKIGKHATEHAEVTSKLALLSQRERQVLDGLVAGKPNKIIAFDLGISPRTVEIYRANVMTKMQAGSLSDLVRMTLLAETDGEASGS
jgi:two-component system, LuxR family, response regulator FixJ